MPGIRKLAGCAKSYKGAFAGSLALLYRMTCDATLGLPSSWQLRSNVCAVQGI